MISRRQTHPLRRRIAAWTYAAIGVVSLALGAVYLFRDSFMPYHSVALGKEWSEVGPETQVLLKALMEVAAAGWLSLGVLLLVLVAIPIRRGDRWARLAAPIAILVFYVPTLLATLSVLEQTPASPPWQGNLGNCVAAVIALLLDAPWQGDRTPARAD